MAGKIHLSRVVGISQVGTGSRSFMYTSASITPCSGVAHCLARRISSRHCSTADMPPLLPAPVFSGDGPPFFEPLASLASVPSARRAVQLAECLPGFLAQLLQQKLPSLSERAACTASGQWAHWPGVIVGGLILSEGIEEGRT
eukprot:CAMPEP_0174704924 /NCGR_PEP_ID=MMETSP1094-20130205/8331_1 /TAXON_ID=156173 /ORGANISM="Chrysochromulina brevifilum, Strain UTEX LB 985" /LENGTH=142 /DNA_ID=CAMNT_0015903025 /DNA_START=458 /DNA_END=886 /DNA_ORIENTATION=+